MNIKKWVKSWILPEEEKRMGELYLRTADDEDAYKAKQLVNLALGDVESDDDEPYMLGSVDMD